MRSTGGYREVRKRAVRDSSKKRRCQGRQMPTIASPRYSDGDDSIWYNSGQPGLARI